MLGTRLTKALALIVVLLVSTAYAGPLEKDFASPPDSARPWVWAHWLDGNVTKESITTDLEAMKRVGLGGLCMFDVGQGTPPGPLAYLDKGWQEAFGHEVAEAKRLGLEMSAHAGPGWCGNGGPWIAPEDAMQMIVFSETKAEGGKHFAGTLPQPKANGKFYRDVAVLAVNETSKQSTFRIQDFDLKRVVWLKWINYKGTGSAAPDATAPADVCISRENVVNLTGRMTPDGSLQWDAPPGAWTLLRFGHTWTSQETGPWPQGGRGPECDKLNKKGIRAHFEKALDTMLKSAGPEAGKTFHTLFVDSWEAGGQNWTARMPEEFKARRGYDIIPLLPILAGRVIGDLQHTERFLYDLRQTVSELAVENFWAEFYRLAHQRGMRLSVETYITTGNDLDAANFNDEPAGEFWALGSRYEDSVKSMSSVAHLNNLPIVSAEAFTSDATEKWRLHPAAVKALGDRMLCLGANRFWFHRYAMQCFPNLVPGITMGPWGLHYERTQTWWEWTTPWHEYLARCQHMLRQGRPVSDVLAVVPEEPLYRFKQNPIPGHDYDACGPDTFKRVTVKDGTVGIPDGQQYRLITVDHTGAMTLGRIRQLRDLVANGANLLCEPPKVTPGLQNLPQADEELKSIAAELWGAAGETDRKVGKGRVFRGISPADALAKLGVVSDFSATEKVSWIHRADQETDIYFIASSAEKPVTATCTFRVHGKHAELWDPEAGKTSPLNTTAIDDQRLIARLPIGPVGSAFIIFRPGNAPSTALTTREEKSLGQITGPWTLSFPKNSGAPESVTLDQLTSWSLHADDNVKHFSGTAVYRKDFTVPEIKSRLLLDLGRVEVMARVKVNGKDLGILWKSPFRIDITDAVKPGTNTLEISVVNLWVNRLIGDQSLPEDAKRDTKGKLTAWPQWVLDGKPSPTGRRSFATLSSWKKGDPLVESGLLGPVQLIQQTESPLNAQPSK